jgi:hypothetical protein
MHEDRTVKAVLSPLNNLDKGFVLEILMDEFAILLDCLVVLA